MPVHTILARRMPTRDSGGDCRVAIQKMTAVAIRSTASAYSCARDGVLKTQISTPMQTAKSAPRYAMIHLANGVTGLCSPAMTPPCYDGPCYDGHHKDTAPLLAEWECIPVVRSSPSYAASGSWRSRVVRADAQHIAPRCVERGSIDEDKEGEDRRRRPAAVGDGKMTGRWSHDW
jgi:hypothetical protein